MPLASPAFFVSCLAAFTASFFLRAVQVLIIESMLFRFSFCIRFLLLVFLRSFAYRTYALTPLGNILQTFFLLGFCSDAGFLLSIRSCCHPLLRWNNRRIFRNTAPKSPPCTSYSSRKNSVCRTVSILFETFLSSRYLLCVLGISSFLSSVYHGEVYFVNNNFELSRTFLVILFVQNHS